MLQAHFAVAESSAVVWILLTAVEWHNGFWIGTKFFSLCVYWCFRLILLWRGPHSFGMVSDTMATILWKGHYCHQGTHAYQCRLCLRRILFHTDNMVVVAILQTHSGGRTLVQHLFHYLFFYSALHQFDYYAEHVPGVLNVAANTIPCDNISQLPTFLPQVTQALVPVLL